MSWQAKETVNGWCVLYADGDNELVRTYANGFGKLGAIGYVTGTKIDVVRMREIGNKVREEFVGARRFGGRYSGARMLISQHIASALNEAGIKPCA